MICPLCTHPQRHKKPFQGAVGLSRQGNERLLRQKQHPPTSLDNRATVLYTYSMSMLTYNYRIKDATSRKHLLQMAAAINYVWNYANEVSIKAFRRDKTFLSAYDLHKLTAGTSKDLRLSADTIQQVCTEYVTRRRQFKKITP